MAKPTIEQIETARLLAKNDWEENFVESIVEQIHEGRNISDKQMAIIERILGNATKGKKGEGKSFRPEPQGEGEFPKVSQLLQLAGKKLKYPKITFSVANQQVVVSLAPSHGKNPGAAYIKVDGDYYGKVSANGHLTAYNEVTGIRTFLEDMNEDASMAARVYGHRTGRCCFCNAKLTTHESSSHGYGPVCAKNYGLVWSKTSADDILGEEDRILNQ